MLNTPSHLYLNTNNMDYLYTLHYDTRKQRTDGISLFFLKAQKLGSQSAEHLKFDFSGFWKLYFDVFILVILYENLLVSVPPHDP